MDPELARYNALRKLFGIPSSSAVGPNPGVQAQIRSLPREVRTGQAPVGATKFPTKYGTLPVPLEQILLNKQTAPTGGEYLPTSPLTKKLKGFFENQYNEGLGQTSWPDASTPQGAIDYPRGFNTQNLVPTEVSQKFANEQPVPKRFEFGNPLSGTVRKDAAESGNPLLGLGGPYQGGFDSAGNLEPKTFESNPLPEGVDPNSTFAKFYQMESRAANAAKEKSQMNIRTLRGNVPGNIGVSLPGKSRRSAARGFYNSQFVDPENRSALMTQIKRDTGELGAENKQDAIDMHWEEGIKNQVPISKLIMGAKQLQKTSEKAFVPGSAFPNGQPGAGTGPPPGEVKPLWSDTWGAKLDKVAESARFSGTPAGDVIDELYDTDGNGNSVRNVETIDEAVQKIINRAILDGATSTQQAGALLDPIVKRVLSHFPKGSKGYKKAIKSIMLYGQLTEPWTIFGGRRRGRSVSPTEQRITNAVANGTMPLEEGERKLLQIKKEHDEKGPSIPSDYFGF